MAKHPCFPIWTDAYLADTTHLSTTEHGAYLLLLMTMWRNDGTLPNDDKLLARYAGLTAGQWRKMRATILAFFEVSENEITQSRLTDELVAVRQKSKRQSDKAKSRHLKNNKKNSAAAEPRECRNDASLNPKLESTNVDSPPNPQSGESGIGPPIVLNPWANHENDGVVWDGETLTLVNGTRAEWLKRFDGDAERLDLALTQVAGSIRRNSTRSVKVQVTSGLARIAADKIDRDKRYENARQQNAKSRPGAETLEDVIARRRAQRSEVLQ